MLFKELRDKWNIFYKDKIIRNKRYIHMLEYKLKNYLPKGEPFDSIWIDLRLSHTNFFTTINYPRSIIAFITLLPILFVLNFIYLLFLVMFVIYWVYKFFVFLYLPTRPEVKFIKPYRWHIYHHGGYILTFLYLYCFYRAYLKSYSFIYKVLVRLYTPTKFNNNLITNLSVVLVGGFLLTIRYIIGLPLRVIYDSFLWSFKFRYFWSKNALSYEDNQKLNEVYSIFRDMSMSTYRGMVVIERCVVYKSSKLRYGLYFNPWFIINSLGNVPLKSTSLPRIINRYIPQFEEFVNFESFRVIKNDGCFGQYHSGSTVNLNNGYVMVNFITSKPKYNLETPIRYMYDGRWSYETTGLVLPKEKFVFVSPKIPNPDRDFRTLFYKNRLYVDSIINHILFDSKVGVYDPLLDNCTESLTNFDELNHNLDWLNDLKSDLRSDPQNIIFFENLSMGGVVDLKTHVRDLVLLQGLEPSNNLTTQINKSFNSLKSSSWVNIEL